MYYYPDGSLQGWGLESFGWQIVSKLSPVDILGIDPRKDVRSVHIQFFSVITCYTS